MDYESILYETGEGIATITLNRPDRLNAWTRTMQKEVHDAMHRAAVDDAVDWFMDPVEGITDQDFWEIMALRHGIFFQGGYPIAVMTESERNLGGHAAHLSAGGTLIIGGMPG